MSKQESKFTNFLRISILLVGLLVAALLALNLYNGGIWIIQGLNGTNGVNGTNGTDGKDGQNGKSAYELACENGRKIQVCDYASAGTDWKNEKNKITVWMNR